MSPGTPARLHRRLRRAVTVANLSAGMAPAAFTLRDVAGELVARAVAIDDVLVAAYGLQGEVRRPRLVRLSADVHEIEVSAARLHQLSDDWRRYLDQSVSPTAMALPTLQERLDSVEAALNELPSPVAAPPPRLTR